MAAYACENGHTVDMQTDHRDPPPCLICGSDSWEEVR